MFVLAQCGARCDLVDRDDDSCAVEAQHDRLAGCRDGSGQQPRTDNAVRRTPENGIMANRVCLWTRRLFSSSSSA
jgi:hypothetical protein